MHPSPPTGPNQPYGQGQPQQHLQQGGQGYPQPPLPQVPGQNPGPGQPYGVPGRPVPGPPQFKGSPGAPDAMPGPALAVRILMFIGGPCGIVLSGIVAVMALLSAGIWAATDASAQAMGVDVDSPIGSIAALGGVGAVVPLVYGISSIWIAAIMGRRQNKTLRAVVIFNITALVILVLNIITLITMGMQGNVWVVIPVLFHGTMTGLMFLPSVKAFYKS